MVEAHVGEVICGRKVEEERKQGIGWGNANEDGGLHGGEGEKEKIPVFRV